ncbi:hypothetical protein EPUL_003508 [Erysiphe pulchra]|uniref:Uncharacterized protein n=1 Tax=Erysiphe pulchra TaxID=225359 RepID=A0A2S4PSD5_9PEZI|nr:hypothetical protein EPUL_003508 [Erysiphe pulchra]
MKTTGPYDKNFEAILHASGIYGYPYIGPKTMSSVVPLNLEEMIERANEPRPSVTPVTIPSSIFELFKRSVMRAKNESEVVKYFVPILEGGIRVENQGSKNISFSNSEPLTDANIEQRALVEGTPDRFYGTSFERLCEEHQIFFLELKSPWGRQQTANFQAQYHGALGERGQIALRSWGHDASVLDGKAHTISCTFVSGTVRFYAIHAARDIDGRIKYFMHGIDAFVMDFSVLKFRNAIAAFQNLQNYSEEKRNEAIELANTRAQEIREAS